MATKTTNFNLTKPELVDSITPTVFADNFDLIDSAMATNREGAVAGTNANTKVNEIHPNGRKGTGEPSSNLGTNCLYYQYE